MKKIIGLLSLLILLTTGNFTFAQKSKSPSKDINLFADSVEGENLPKGWSSGGCTKAAFQSGSIYFEINSPEDLCRLSFTTDMPDGKYTLSATYGIDGNSPEIEINTKSLEKTNPVESVGGKLNFVIAVGGQGKVWGNLYKMTLTKVKTSPKVKVSNKPTIGTAEQMFKDIGKVIDKAP